MQAVGPVAVTSLLLGSGIPGIIDAPVQDDPNNPHNAHAQQVYNHAAIQARALPQGFGRISPCALGTAALFNSLPSL